MWQSEVIEPATRAGKRPDEILGIDFGDQMSVLIERAAERGDRKVPHAPT